MKKGIVVALLVGVMVFGFASTAMAHHSPQFYFNWQAGDGVTLSPAFEEIWGTADVEFSINNGSYSDGTASPHKNYSQTTAKCGVCHSVHRAPVYGTGSTATPTTSSRYTLSQYTVANADTNLLLKSTANGACDFCHVSSGYYLMYGGDATKQWVSGPSTYSWNEFYGHSTSCTQCHAVHGANTLPGSKILKYMGVAVSNNVELNVQEEIYENSPLYANYADMTTNTLKASAVADGVTQNDAAITVNCSTCHNNYSPDNNTMINADYHQIGLFQYSSWASANGSTENVTFPAGPPYAPYSNLGRPVIVNANTMAMRYHNHPMKNADDYFTSAGASLNAQDGPVSVSDSYTCRSCHNSPEAVLDGRYYIQSWPHYTPGYYKFMAAQNQSAFDTPNTLAEVNLGRFGFYNSFRATQGRAGRPAVMNDGYCKKCHVNVGGTGPNAF